MRHTCMRLPGPAWALPRLLSTGPLKREAGGRLARFLGVCTSLLDCDRRSQPSRSPKQKTKRWPACPQLLRRALWPPCADGAPPRHVARPASQQRPPWRPPLPAPPPQAPPLTMPLWLRLRAARLAAAPHGSGLGRCCRVSWCRSTIKIPTSLAGAWQLCPILRLMPCPAADQLPNPLITSAKCCCVLHAVAFEPPCAAVLVI